MTWTILLLFLNGNVCRPSVSWYTFLCGHSRGVPPDPRGVGAGAPKIVKEICWLIQQRSGEGARTTKTGLLIPPMKNRSRELRCSEDEWYNSASDSCLIRFAWIECVKDVLVKMKSIDDAAKVDCFVECGCGADMLLCGIMMHGQSFNESVCIVSFESIGRRGMRSVLLQ